MDTRQVKDYRELRAQLEEQVREAAPPALAEKLLPLMRPAITLYDSATKDDAIPSGISKIGGQPDLPAGTAWPEGPNGPLHFAAQINLGQVKPYDLAGELPGRGLLSFFFDSNAPFSNQVLLLPHDNLSRVNQPDKAQAAGFLNRLQTLFLGAAVGDLPAHSVEFDTDCQLPSPGAPELERLLTAQEKQFYVDEVWPEVDIDWGGHQLLGYVYREPEEVQVQTADVESAFNGVRAATSNSPLAASSWRLLLQLVTLGKSMPWGDSDSFCFSIHEDALKAQRFDKCRTSLEVA